jgi:hypothetical protein
MCSKYERGIQILFPLGFNELFSWKVYEFIKNMKNHMILNIPLTDELPLF